MCIRQILRTSYASHGSVYQSCPSQLSRSARVHAVHRLRCLFCLLGVCTLLLAIDLDVDGIIIRLSARHNMVGDTYLQMLWTCTCKYVIRMFNSRHALPYHDVYALTWRPPACWNFAMTAFSKLIQAISRTGILLSKCISILSIRTGKRHDGADCNEQLLVLYT